MDLMRVETTDLPKVANSAGEMVALKVVWREF